jgi:hypothetical protein
MNLTPEMLKELKAHATAIDSASVITSPNGLVAPSPWMLVNPRAVLALLDRIEALETAARRVVDELTDMKGAEAYEALAAVLDQKEPHV